MGKGTNSLGSPDFWTTYILLSHNVRRKMDQQREISRDLILYGRVLLRHSFIK